MESPHGFSLANKVVNRLPPTRKRFVIFGHMLSRPPQKQEMRAGILLPAF